MGSPARLAILSALAVGCSPDAPPPSEPLETGAAFRVPAEIAGGWRLDRQECYPDEPDAIPDTDLADVNLYLDETGTYRMNIEGWESVGSFSIDNVDDTIRVTMDDTLLKFDAIDGTLQNWSEGDATYICGNVFERDRGTGVEK